MFLDQAKTKVVNDFTWDIATYPASTNPNLDGKPVLVFAVKGDTDVSYSLTDTEKTNARTNIGLNNAIISGSQTITSSADGGSNVYTFTDASGNISTITVKNGSKGSTGATGAKGDTENA